MMIIRAIFLTFLTLLSFGVNADVIGWWTGNGNANDSSGLHNDGAFSGSYSPGRLGSDQAFDLATGIVTIPDHPAYDLQAYSDWSVSFWFNQNGNYPTNMTFLGQDVGLGEKPKWFIDYNYGYSAYGPPTAATANAFELHLNNWGSTPREFLQSASVSIPAGWNEFTLTKVPNWLTFYLNGASLGTVYYSGIIPDVPASLIFGYLEPCCGYNGLIQDIVITASVPEPDIYVMMSLGLCVAGWQVRRQRLRSAGAGSNAPNSRDVSPCRRSAKAV